MSELFTVSATEMFYATTARRYCACCSPPTNLAAQHFCQTELEHRPKYAERGSDEHGCSLRGCDFQLVIPYLSKRNVAAVLGGELLNYPFFFHATPP